MSKHRGVRSSVLGAAAVALVAGMTPLAAAASPAGSHDVRTATHPASYAPEAASTPPALSRAAAPAFGGPTFVHLPADQAAHAAVTNEWWYTLVPRARVRLRGPAHR